MNYSLVTGIGGGGGGGGGGMIMPISAPVTDPTGAGMPTPGMPGTPTLPGSRPLVVGEEARMEMLPSPFFCILIVPCFSSS